MQFKPMFQASIKIRVWCIYVDIHINWESNSTVNETEVSSKVVLS